MSVLYPDEVGAEWAGGVACFYCGRVNGSYPAVMWMGEVAICLHVACAERLGAQLIGDAREARLAGATGDASWPRRAARCVRETLQAQEGQS